MVDFVSNHPIISLGVILIAAIVACLIDYIKNSPVIYRGETSDENVPDLGKEDESEPYDPTRYR